MVGNIVSGNFVPGETGAWTEGTDGEKKEENPAATRGQIRNFADAPHFRVFKE